MFPGGAAYRGPASRAAGPASPPRRRPRSRARDSWRDGWRRCPFHNRYRGSGRPARTRDRSGATGPGGSIRRLQSPIVIGGHGVVREPDAFSVRHSVAGDPSAERGQWRRTGAARRRIGQALTPRASSRKRRGRMAPSRLPSSATTTSARGPRRGDSRCCTWRRRSWNGSSGRCAGSACGLSMTEGLGRLGRGAGRGRVILTFDDGYADTLTAALPLLRRYDCRAICYVVSDCIGGHNRWDDGEGRERQAADDPRARSGCGWKPAWRSARIRALTPGWTSWARRTRSARFSESRAFLSGHSGSQWITLRTRSAASRRRPSMR